MKTIILSLLLFLSLTACSSDDDGKQTQEEELPVSVENLTGTWLAVQRSSNNGNDFKPFENIERNEQYTYEFKMDNTVISVDINNSESCKGSYSVQNSRIEANFNCSESSLELSVLILTEKQMIVRRSFADEAIKTRFQKQN